MSSEGPTTTGSIDAKLTIDKSAWDRSVAEAKAEARELGALSPEVKIGVDVGPALAKMAEVEAVERQLEATNVRLAATEKIVDREQVQSTSSAMRLATVEKLLGEAHKETAAKAAEQAVAEQANTQATDKGVAASDRAGAANNRRVSGLQVLLALSPAILAAAAPIAAGAVGLGVAFGVMGVSGVLAIKGIKDEMAAGSTAGNQYAAGLGVLKGSLDTLSATSANAMLGSFNGAVGDINARMPFLNQLVGEGAGLLGQMGGTALSGVLNGLQQMNPLIQQGGVELGKFVTWLFSFTGTNGFTEFINYAMANLPSVMHLIESLVTTSGHILAAFAPLGPVVIGLITALSDGLSSLPTPVLAGLVTTATLLGPALRIAGTAMALFGVESNLAVPVVGVLLAALSGLGIMAATAAAGTGQGTTALVDYGNAIERDNGLIGENTRLQAAHAATTTEMRDAADQLGVSTQTVIAAMLGNKDAQDQVTQATHLSVDGVKARQRAGEDLIDADDRLHKAETLLSGGVDSSSSAIQNNVETYKALHAVTDQTTGATSAQTAAVQLQAGVYGTTVQMYQNATAAQQAAATQTAQQTANMQKQNDAAGLLKQAWDALNGKTLSAAQAQNSFDSSLVNMGDHMSATGTKITFTTTSIDDMSSASVALRGQLNGQVANLEGVIEANGGVSKTTAQSAEQYAEMRQKIIDNAVAHGVNRDAVETYIDKIFQVPKAVKTDLELNADQALADIESFKWHLANIQNRIVTVTEQTVKDPGGMGSSIGGRENGSLAGGQASGGMVPEHWATGGFPGRASGTDTVPTWLTPGEGVMKRSSVQSIGPAAFNYMNQTGKLPGGGGGGPVTVNLILDGQIIDTRIVDLTNQTIDGVARQIGGMRR